MRVIHQDAVEAKDLGGMHSQARGNEQVLRVKSLLCRDWVCRDLLDSFGGRPLFGDGPVTFRDIHDVSAL